MKIRSYRCPKCGREYNFADGNKTRLCRVCGCELDSLTVYSTDGGSTEKDQASATRRENREAEEQEALFVWAEYQSAAHTELKLLYHIPNEGKRSVSYGAALRRQGMKKGVPDLCLPVARGKYHGLYIEMKAAETSRRSTSNGGLKRLNDRVSALCGAPGGSRRRKKYRNI